MIMIVNIVTVIDTMVVMMMMALDFVTTIRDVLEEGELFSAIHTRILTRVITIIAIFETIVVEERRSKVSDEHS